MTSREVGTIKSIVLGAAAAACLALPAQAGDNKLAFSVGDDGFTTDYMFRSYSASASETRSAGRIRCDIWHVLRRHLGIQYLIMGMASSSIIMPA